MERSLAPSLSLPYTGLSKMISMHLDLKDSGEGLDHFLVFVRLFLEYILTVERHQITAKLSGRPQIKLLRALDIIGD